MLVFLSCFFFFFFSVEYIFFVLCFFIFVFRASTNTSTFGLVFAQPALEFIPVFYEPVRTRMCFI